MDECKPLLGGLVYQRHGAKFLYSGCGALNFGLALAGSISK